MTDALVTRLGAGAFAGFAVAFLAINLGLRLFAEGRAFLAAARAVGRVFARPGPATPPRIRAVFALARALAIVAGVAVFFAPGALLFSAPVPHPVPTAELAR